MAGGGLLQESIRIPAGREYLHGELVVPEHATAIVIFVHGSGSSRFSSRNRFVAEQLNNRGLATLLFDLLTETEESIDNTTRKYRFDIPLLTERLITTTDWLRQRNFMPNIDIGYFGASTGAAAALAASVHGPHPIKAIVCRGGRPDLAGVILPKVSSPTLLIVGSEDYEVYELNRKAQSRMGCRNEIKIVQGASHLFEEPGALEKVAKYAGDWFSFYLIKCHSELQTCT